MDLVNAGNFDHETFVDGIFAAAFERAHNLEKIFSRFSNEPLSIRENNEDFNVLLGHALDIQEKTDAVFRVRKDAGFSLDLDGISKGYIVDCVVDEITALISNPEFLRIFYDGGKASGSSNELFVVKGVVNAGGDMRFFNTKAKWGYMADDSAPTPSVSTGTKIPRFLNAVDLRLGNYDSPVIRHMETARAALATSSLTVSKNNAQSTTRYELKLRPNLTADHAAVVLADLCSVADALTKVALFGNPTQIQNAANAFSSEILIFDGFGEITERYIGDGISVPEFGRDSQTLDLFSELFEL